MYDMYILINNFKHSHLNLYHFNEHQYLCFFFLFIFETKVIYGEVTHSCEAILNPLIVRKIKTRKPLLNSM